MGHSYRDSLCGENALLWGLVGKRVLLRGKGELLWRGRNSCRVERNSCGVKRNSYGVKRNFCGVNRNSYGVKRNSCGEKSVVNIPYCNIHCQEFTHIIIITSTWINSCGEKGHSYRRKREHLTLALVGKKGTLVE